MIVLDQTFDAPHFRGSAVFAGRGTGTTGNFRCNELIKLGDKADKLGAHGVLLVTNTKLESEAFLVVGSIHITRRIRGRSTLVDAAQGGIAIVKIIGRAESAHDEIFVDRP